MSQNLNPYISFGTNASEALNFYQSVLGGEVTTSHFKEFGMEGADGDLVMHGQLDTPSGMTLMAADTPSFMTRETGSSITIALTGDDSSALRGYYDGLSDGGTVTTKLEKQMWGDEYGALTDKYGVNWMFNISTPSEG